MYSSHSIVRVTCLRLSSRRISAQSGSTWRRWPCFVPAAANSAVSSALSVISAGNGQLNPALASRFKVNRTVDGATPSRRAISLSPTPAVLKRSTSRTWRITVLSAGIRSPVQKPKERTLIGQQRRRLTERHHPGMAGEIISERRARSNRNGGRHHRGFAGDFLRNPHPELGLLLTGDAQGFAIQFLGGLGMPLPQQQLALVPVELQEDRRMIRGSPCPLRIHPAKIERTEIQLVDEHV